MKLNKRIKSSLIQTFIFNVILLIMAVVFAVFVLWPSFLEIQEKKTALSAEYDRVNSMDKNGIEFQDFKALSNTAELSGYLKEIIKTTSADFYERNFKNKNAEQNFESFISQKETAVLAEKKASLLQDKTEIVDTLLPIYVTNDWEEWMTDFEFINYVESLLYSFNLISRNSIWVWELKRVDDSDITKTHLDSNMFYIPLELQITWQKWDIIDFIHYFENVWSIGISEGNPEIYTDKALSKKLVWSGDADNIYKNQLSDIQRLSMDAYIDASSDVSRWSLSDFVKTTQNRQRFSAGLELRFYVQWLPDYKIQNYVQSVVSMHANLLKESQQALKLTFNNAWTPSSSTLNAKNAIRSAANVLTVMQDDIKKLRVSLWKKDQDLTVVYSEAEEYKSRLDKIQVVMQESANVLNTNK